MFRNNISVFLSNFSILLLNIYSIYFLDFELMIFIMLFILDLLIIYLIIGGLQIYQNYLNNGKQILFDIFSIVTLPVLLFLIYFLINSQYEIFPHIPIKFLFLQTVLILFSYKKILNVLSEKKKIKKIGFRIYARFFVYRFLLLFIFGSMSLWLVQNFSQSLIATMFVVGYFFVNSLYPVRTPDEMLPWYYQDGTIPL